MTERTRFIVKVTALALACLVFIGAVLTIHFVETAEAERLLVNINTATAEEFAALPAMTEELLTEILAYREHFVRFSSLEELLSVDGVTEDHYHRWRPYLTI